MKRTLTMLPHERFKLLRSGEKVLCKKCKDGTLQAVGNHKETNTFVCSKCGAQMIVD